MSTICADCSHTSTSHVTDCFSPSQSLTKPPGDYPDKKGQPHVQVALRMMSRNVHVQAGDVIPYAMCQVSPQGKELPVM